MTSAKQLHREIGQVLSGDHRDPTVVRRPDYETRSKGNDPGMDPPSFGDLGVGKAAASYKDLYWSRLIAEYKKEAPLRERDSESALRVSLYVEHVSDTHTPLARVEWPDPIDVRGAINFAKLLVEDGALYVHVKARVWRPTNRGKAFLYDLAKWVQA